VASKEAQRVYVGENIKEGLKAFEEVNFLYHITGAALKAIPQKRKPVWKNSAKL